MSTREGARFGPYRIGTLLGAGGMGEVYRARDTRLDRDVAVKVLRGAFSRESEAMARFDREAHLISRLSHPHICSVHDVGEHDGSAFIVMECLEGETLADRLKRGAVPVPQALSIATQIAEALDHAHRLGVIHRDIKPGNVMLTKSGVKLLDFGLAKLIVDTAEPDRATVAVDAMTRVGTFLGTPQYMAPEQIRGHPTDHRTDIFAFGALLYELFAGRRAFEGPTVADVTAAIVTMPAPSLSAAQPLAPPALDHVVARCLEKDPNERWQSVFDVASQLRWIADPANSYPALPQAGAWTTRRRLSPLAVGLCGLVAGAATYAAATAPLRQSPPASPQVIRSVVPLPPKARLAAARPSVAISPDGRFLAFVGGEGEASRLFVRPVDAFDSVPVSGSDAATGPFFSPDGESIGFFANGRLMRIARSGGRPTFIAEVPDGRGATWGPDNTIVYSARLDSGLFRVPAGGGSPEPVTTPARERREKTHRFPDLLPDGRSVMFTIGTHDIATFDDASIAVQSLAGGEPKIVITGGAVAKYLPSGHIVYARGDALLAVPFDVDRLEVSGPPVTVVEGVVHATDYGRVEYDVSDTGTLVYLPGGDTSQQSVIVSVNRRGEFTPLTSQPRLFLSVEYSPKGDSLLTIIGGANDTGWIYDIRRDVPSRLTFKGNVTSASWTPDGTRVVYSQAGELASIAADGSGHEELLFRDDTQIGSPTLTADGTYLLFQTAQPRTGYDIWSMSPQTRQTSQWLSTPFRESSPRISRNGRWVAYVSNESGRNEVYVRAMPVSSVKTQVSRDGGRLPTWSADGRELFFLQEASLMAATVTTAADIFESGRPSALFKLRRLPNDDGVIYGVAPDGRSFVAIEPLTTYTPTVAHLIAGWSREVLQKALVK